MGRRKVSLKFISDKKSRQSSFLKRSKRLQKKANELQELGGVDTLLICYDEQGLLRTWPEAPPDIHRIISRYYSVNEVQRKRYTQSLPNFCGHKGNKSEQEQSFPISDGQLDGLLEKIQQEIAALDDKSDVVRQKIESIKRSMNQSELVIPHSQSDQKNVNCAPTFDFNHLVSMNYTASSIYQHGDMGLLYPCSPMSMQFTELPDFSNFDDDFLGDANLSNPPVLDAYDWWDMEYLDNALDNNNDGLRSSEVGAPCVVGSGDPSAMQLPNVSFQQNPTGELLAPSNEEHLEFDENISMTATARHNYAL